MNALSERNRCTERVRLAFYDGFVKGKPEVCTPTVINISLFPNRNEEREEEEEAEQNSYCRIRF